MVAKSCPTHVAMVVGWSNIVGHCPWVIAYVEENWEINKDIEKGKQHYVLASECLN